MFRIADAHCDTLYAIGVDKKPADACTVTRERMEKGGVALQTFALFAGAQGPAGQPYEKAQAMLAAKDAPGVRLFTEDLPDELPCGPSGVISIEGGEILEGSVTRLDEFYAMFHCRLIALTWNNENEIGYPSKTDGPGLKPFGKHLLREMDLRGIFADCSHLSRRGFWDVCEHASLPPVASHSNAKALCDVHRNLDDDQIRAVIEKGGFIGLNFYSSFLASGRPALIEDVLAMADHIMELGGEDVLGFGSDFDGIESWPEGLGDPADFPALCDAFLKRGYTEKQVEKIAGLNYFSLLKRGEKAAVIRRG